MWIVIVIAVVALLLLTWCVVATLTRRGRKTLPRTISLTFWLGTTPSDEECEVVESHLQVLLDHVQEICKGPTGERLPRLTPLAMFGTPGIETAVLELALVDHFEEEIGAMTPIIERTVARIAASLCIEPADIEFRLDAGPEGTTAPPGPCLNGEAISPSKSMA